MATHGKRVYFLDFLKILAIGFVFLHHILMDLYVVHPMHNLSVLGTLLIRPNMNMAMIACATFILISGATLTINERDESPIEFYKRRLFRILIPFYIAYFMCLCIKIINMRTLHVFSGIPAWRFVFTLMGMDEYLSANGIATYTLGVGEWFLGCIMICYLAFPFLRILCKKWKYVTFVVMTIYFIIINIVYYDIDFKIPSYMNVICQIYNFYLGMFLIDIDLISKIKKWVLFISIPIIAIFYLYNGFILIPDNFKTTIVVLAIYISFSFLDKVISENKTFVSGLTFFNKISFEIFLVHHFIIYQVDYLLSYERIGGITTLVVILIDVFLTIVCALVVHFLTWEMTKLVDKTKHK